MDRVDLSRGGFSHWHPFELDQKQALLLALPVEPGVFAVAHREPRVCPIGKSSIIFVGVGANAGGLRTRVQQCFTPGCTQATNRRLHAMMKSRDLDLAYRACESADAASALRMELLDSFEAEHGELPLLNLRR